MFQSLSDEDSFKKMSSTKEVLEKIQELLGSLVERWGTLSSVKSVTENSVSNLVFFLKSRMHKDGRQPHTFRLTIRRYAATNKWFSRESRQAPIPPHVAQKITTGELIKFSKTVLQCLSSLWPFHLLSMSSVMFSSKMR